MIKNIDEAFRIIESIKKAIPYEAIKYLQEQPVNKKITDKIVYSLEHAYDNDVYFDADEDVVYSTPLWYAIVAEKHISEELINPIIELYTIIDYGWDFLEEECGYLVGLISEKYPDTASEKILNAIENQIDKRSESSYLYLFDVLYFADLNKYKEKILHILQKENFKWIDAYLNPIADLQIKEAIPIIEKLLQREYEQAFVVEELKYALERLKTGRNDYPSLSKPYCYTRENWINYYKKLERDFFSPSFDDEEDNFIL